MTIKMKPGVVAEVPVGALQRDPTQPRQTFDQDAIARLSESIKPPGRVRQPLTVRQNGKQIIIVDGERRWRAAKLAKLKTVPCLLDESKDQLDIAATQITTAVQREDLKPLDIAEFLAGLQKAQKLPMNGLLKALADRGIKEIGAAKVERYLSLLELPDWAKDHLRDGTFTERHGQVVLQAAKFPHVLKELKTSVTGDVKWSGGVTVHQLQGRLETAFQLSGIDLNRQHGNEEQIRAFPINQCRGCEYYKKIGGREYCLNRGEFDKKQKQALLLKAESEARKASTWSRHVAARDSETDPAKVEPRKLKLSEHNVAVLKRMSIDHRRRLDDAKFDKTQCQTCAHRQLASHDGSTKGAEDHCFHPPCYNLKESQDSRVQSRKGKMREYLERWLRPVVEREAPKRLDPNATYGLVIWLATGAVDRYSKWFHGQMHARAADETRKFIEQHKLIDLQAFLTFGESKLEQDHWNELVQAAVRTMTREQLRWFAHYCKIGLEESGIDYRIDEEYLRMKRKAEMIELAKARGIESVAGLGAKELRAYLLEEDHRSSIAVPEELERLYREEFKADVDEDEEDIEDLDDDDAAALDDAVGEMDEG